MKLIPKNWVKFQHYKDRCPPWIKLHRDLLNDRIFASLPIASKALAPLLWLLASESKDGTFDAAIEELAFRLHIASKDIEAGLKPLIDKGFFLDASTMLAPCLQVAIPERETETERETEGEAKKALKSATPDGVSESLWKDFLAIRKAKKLPVTDTAIQGLKREAAAAGKTLSEALTICCERGWGGFNAKWLERDAPTGGSKQLTMQEEMALRARAKK
jgi:sarcosine oxidase delta subunit